MRALLTHGLAPTACRFFYKPITLTALTIGLAALAYVAMTQDVLEEGRDKRRMYVPLFLLGHAAQFLLQRGICRPGFLSHVLDDSVPRRAFRSAASCHVEGRPRHQSPIRTRACFSSLPGLGFGQNHDDPSRSLFGRTPPGKELCGRLCTDGEQHLG